MENSHLTIVPVGPDELGEVINLYRSVAKKMNSMGLFNWNDTYPDIQSISFDIAARRLISIREKNIRGVITQTENQPAEYDTISWKYTAKPVLVIRRLAILPQYQGQGLARALMKYSEEYAVNQSIRSIRLDVYAPSKAARSLYQKLEYEERGEFRFPGNEIPFVAMEKRIPAAR